MNIIDPMDPLFFLDNEIEALNETDFQTPGDFDESAYLQAFPGIARAIQAGQFESAVQHYRLHGLAEGLLASEQYRRALRGEAVDTETFPATGIDAVFVSGGGRCLVIGWLNDDTTAPVSLAVMAGSRVLASSSQVARCRREDAEAVVTTAAGKLLGFWSVIVLPTSIDREAVTSVALTAGRERRTIAIKTIAVSEDRLRQNALEYLATSKYFANPQVESFIQMETGLGRTLVEMNVDISQKIIDAAYPMRFGPQRGRFEASVIVCLYGKAEFLFLQAALFSEAPGYADYEFIYVSNSPELSETLVKEATLAARIYDASITLVILPGNAGFGAANNAAVNAARSNRILITNPDVFPRDSAWAQKHSALVRDLPTDQTAMFGAPLYYDDGSLMHAGMFIDSDFGLSVRHDRIERREMLRVEHYGKGAPPNTAAFLASRAVPAVTGAFISADRDWFELLGGFSLEYVFGHYEDADLCLKSFAAGQPVWVHNVPFWHLEGKGSTRRVVHEGGSTVNRWHFTKTWGAVVADGMHGAAPLALRAA